MSEPKPEGPLLLIDVNGTNKHIHFELTTKRFVTIMFTIYSIFSGLPDIVFTLLKFFN